MSEKLTQSELYRLSKISDFHADTIKNAVIWDVTRCGSCKNRVSEQCIASIIRVTRISEFGTTLAVTRKDTPGDLPKRRASESYANLIFKMSWILSQL
jgi:hypothetical protein